MEARQLIASSALPLGILVLTILGIVTRPGGTREWIVALIGGAAVLVVGAVDPAAAAGALAEQWNVFLFFLGLMTIAAIADQSGLLAHLVVAAARAARGRADLLLVLVSCVAAIVTVTLSNDATVLLLTPLVVKMAARLQAPILPYAFICAYLANTTSIALPIANPANVIALRTFPLGAGDFLTLLAPSAALASVVTVLAVLWSRRGDLRVRIVVPIPPDGDAGAGAVAVGITLTVCAYLIALELRWPVGVVAVVGGAALVALQAARRYLSADALRRDIAWGIFPLLAGLVIVLRAAEEAGLTEIVGRAIASASPDVVGISVISLGSALMSNAMNNLPWALLATAAVENVAHLDPRIAASLLVGIDVGPNFTTAGSLATLLWLLMLRRRGVALSGLAYARASFVPSTIALVAATLPLLIR